MLFPSFDARRFITYRGTKRKFLQRIETVIGDLGIGQGSFLDLFSGSGIVASYFRFHGYEVAANDIALYSKVLNTTYLTISPDEFAERYPKFDVVLRNLNSLDKPKKEHYFSEYFTEREGTSRLYYTKRNALFIDAVLEEVWSWNDSFLREIVISDLLVKMSVHANTNGVFSGAFKEFGGPTQERLERILHPITISDPYLIDGIKGSVYCDDATEIFKRENIYDIVYIDPPYTSQQYSTNYHLLTYACQPYSERYKPNESEVTGLHPDAHRSAYCRKTQALAEFERLLEAMKSKARYAVISYSANGHVSKDGMIDLLSRYGHVRVTQFENHSSVGAGSRVSQKSIPEYIFTVSL